MTLRGLATAAGMLACSAASAAGPRYPSDLVLAGRDRWIVTSNEQAGTVTLLDRTSGEALDEAALAPRSRPHAVVSFDNASGTTLVAASETFVHSIAVFRVESDSPRLRLARRLDTGRLPEGVAFSADGKTVLAACEGEGEVWEHDLTGTLPPRRISALEGARRVLLISPTRIAVAGRKGIAVIDLAQGLVMARRDLAEGTAINLDGLAAANGRLFIAHPIQPTESPTEPQMLDWGLIIANRVTVLPLDALTEPQGSGRAIERSVSLDNRGRAGGDPGGIAVLPDGRTLLVPSAGTDRVFIVDTGETAGAKRLTPAYNAAPEALRVGDRPVAVRATSDGKLAYVACSLDDAVLEVDVPARKVLRTLRLGPEPEATAEHLGARVFFDADRSRGGWYSCQTCHPDGGTAGNQFNTRSDGRGLAKRSLPLFGVDRTGPWAWLGKFESLQAQVAASLEKTMAVDTPAKAGDVENVIAFLRTLERPAPTRPGEDLGGDSKHGEDVFDRAGCDRCHTPPEYTSRGVRDIGLGDQLDRGRSFNPPSLLGVRDRHRFLHDGRAASIEAVFRDHNARGLHGKAAELSGAEMRDLIAFLKTL